MSSLRILLVRHGETDYNLVRRLQGQRDTLLTPEGVRQAELVAQRLMLLPFTMVYSSDLVRARQTAECIAGKSNVMVHVDARLREMSLGVFQGHTAGEARVKFPDAWSKHQHDASFVIPDGESFAAFEERCNGVMMDIAMKHRHDQVICIVTHGGVIDVIGREWANGKSITKCNNTGICELMFDGEEFDIVSWNDTAHLGDDDDDGISGSDGAHDVLL